PSRNCDFTAEMFCQGNKHQSDRSGSNDQHSLAGSKFRLLDALNHTSQWLGQSRIPKSGLRLESQHIFLGDAHGNNDRFGVRAIEKKQVVAQILLLITAIETIAARSGIGHHHEIANVPFLTLDPGLWALDFSNDAR